jgi:hypothetical protein
MNRIYRMKRHFNMGRKHQNKFYSLRASRLCVGNFIFQVPDFILYILFILSTCLQISILLNARTPRLRGTIVTANDSTTIRE